MSLSAVQSADRVATSHPGTHSHMVYHVRTMITCTAPSIKSLLRYSEVKWWTHQRSSEIIRGAERSSETVRPLPEFGTRASPPEAKRPAFCFILCNRLASWHTSMPSLCRGRNDRLPVQIITHAASKQAVNRLHRHDLLNESGSYVEMSPAGVSVGV